MVRQPSGEWYCPGHALLAVAKHLVSLYRAEGDADWTAISELIDEALSEAIVKMDAAQQ